MWDNQGNYKECLKCKEQSNEENADLGEDNNVRW